MNNQSAVNFLGERRIHIGIAVTDLERSQLFYQTLLGVNPSKIRSNYVKFEPSEPSVNLTLNKVKNISQERLAVEHFGIQVKSKAAVDEAIRRFDQIGLETRVEKQTTCCYAVQDKMWVKDPDGNKWEVFVVLDNDAGQSHDRTLSCCANGG